MNKIKLFDEIIWSIKTIDIMDREQGHEFYARIDRLLEEFKRRAGKISPTDREIFLKEINEVQSNFKEFNTEYTKRVLNLNDEFEVFFFRKFLGYRFKYGESFNDGILDQNRIHEISGRIFTNAGLLGRLKSIIAESTPQPQQNRQIVTGFQSSLTDKQIENLYRQMNGNYLEATPDNFKAIFKSEALPPGCSIQWIDSSKTRHEPNKQTLFEFLYLLKEYGYLEKSSVETTSTNDNNLYRKLETIFPGFKNFPASNPQTTQKNTPRQKELETIILSLKS